MSKFEVLKAEFYANIDIMNGFLSKHSEEISHLSDENYQAISFTSYQALYDLNAGLHTQNIQKLVKLITQAAIETIGIKAVGYRLRLFYR